MVMAYVYGSCLQVHAKYAHKNIFPEKTFSQGEWVTILKADSVKLMGKIKKQNYRTNGYTCSNGPMWVSTFVVQQTFVFAVQNSSRIDVAWKNSSRETLNFSSQVQWFKKSFALIESSLSLSNIYLTAFPNLKQLLYAWLGNCFPICEIAWGHYCWRPHMHQSSEQ